ncbi:DNA-binding transcriptional regulator, AcrR family [Terribacillus halophilus]|uniref:DNA-binding transcriptional regulator, AcrR family n=1 Tax=Terribacillus halophilus TaxID=361279 RepID=A0A1G6LNX1_9BACI|nr:TetR/AcrR family transcriptional regulator [Terribacillus halophilus]SDC44943.1 DNA-binding transcriptional regulator, AcrR family [Terribacillus halophilus]
MNKKEIQKSRMWKYFVEATADIIREEGLEKVTIRKVADRAGYNSATIYNYFSDLSHLIFFASMTFLKDYTDEVVVYMNRSDKPLEKYLLAWECFCTYSFRYPKLFHAIFIMDLGDSPENMLERYYTKFPKDLINIPEELHSTLLERNMSKRGRSALELALEAGEISEKNVDAINELTILIWQGMFNNVLNHRRSYDPQRAMKKTMQYITEIVRNETAFDFSDNKYGP